MDDLQQQLADQQFSGVFFTQDQLKLACEVAEEAQVVWCRLGSYPHWPAQKLPLTKEEQRAKMVKRARAAGPSVADVCVIFFGTYDISYVEEQSTCRSFKDGITARYYNKSKQFKSDIMNATREAIQFCNGENPIVPGKWWGMHFLDTYYDVLENETNNSDFRIIHRKALDLAERDLVYWVEQNNLMYPVQVIPKQHAEDKFPRAFKIDFSILDIPYVAVAFFGTGSVKLVNESSLIRFESGIARGYVTSAGPSHRKFALVQVWDYLQSNRTWPRPLLTGRLWWNEHMISLTDTAARFTEHPGIPYFEYTDKPVWAPASDNRRNKNKRKHDFISGKCSCSERNPSERCQDLSGCINVEMQTFCIKSTCSAGPTCGNRRFPLDSPALEPALKIGKCEWGTHTMHFIPNKAFVVEYTGEILDAREQAYRVACDQATQTTSIYYAQLPENLFLDARHKGNVSRFINTSCEPNCSMVKWSDGPITRIAIFATRDIASGEELFINYHLANSVGFECECGTAACQSLEPAESNSLRMNLGRRLEFKWGNQWLPATVHSYNPRLKEYLIVYDCGDSEVLYLNLPHGNDNDDVEYRYMQ